VPGSEIRMICIHLYVYRNPRESKRQIVESGRRCEQGGSELGDIYDFSDSHISLNIDHYLYICIYKPGERAKEAHPSQAWDSRRSGGLLIGDLSNIICITIYIPIYI